MPSSMKYRFLIVSVSRFARIVEEVQDAEVLTCLLALLFRLFEPTSCVPT